MCLPSGRLAIMPKRTGSQIIWECLVHEGVHTVFGYPGGAILPAYDAMLDYPVRHVLVRHEQGATHMADGFARAGGGVGVAVATSGPGATNAVTACLAAWMDATHWDRRHCCSLPELAPVELPSPVLSTASSS